MLIFLKPEIGQLEVLDTCPNGTHLRITATPSVTSSERDAKDTPTGFKQKTLGFLCCKLYQSHSRS